MGKIVLISGGSRSGKSDFGLQLGNRMPGPRLFIATCPLIDAEMRTRAEKHRQARAAYGWETLEEGRDLEKAVRASAAYQTILIDCLTLWVNNLQWEAKVEFFHTLAEEEMAEYAHRLADACREFDGNLIAVTNEVGLGIVPENPEARLFRDLSGRCNTVMAGAADEVWFCVSGIPMLIKPRGEDK